ncbi:MAG TPA: caspase family protein [Thermoanaerobaculia bacterium]|nr:caspase family protein [Thermoanaerobaculia bacterium]
MRTAILLLVSTVIALTADPQPIGRRRALLIGINDYTASALGRPQGAAPDGREWPNLSGAVNDVSILREMLVERYGFEPRDVVAITDQKATRAAILNAIDRHLLKPAAEGDVLFFYYAGHGSQVRNSKSEEPDRMDESLVPADSRLGARDIRDKELRRLFNRILDRGARLTAILDACHSGSGVRGPGRSRVRARGVRSDDRDVADDTDAGPRPEDRGALVLAAAQDYDRAWERRDEDGSVHGAFSWAWIRAMRDSSAGEPAEETFLRAQARLRAETPFQEPVLAGNADARRNPFLGVHSDRRHPRIVVAIERVRGDGTVVLDGGWANGLSVGSELRSSDARLKITAVTGPARSEACILQGTVHSGALADMVREPERSWEHIESTTEAPAAYRLELRPKRNGSALHDLVLRLDSPVPAPAPPRHYYVLRIDGNGRSVLVYPRSGSVENRFPLGVPAPELVLGSVEIVRRETFFLLSTEEPLPNPWVLESVMPARPPAVAAAGWSLEKVVYESKKSARKTPQSSENSV